MILEKYCKNCGKRLVPNEQYCSGCGSQTFFDNEIEDYVFTVPIYDIGFFNLGIDFSPYIESNGEDFKYEICSCGYLNEKDNEYCYMCGSKRHKSKLSKFFK